MGNPALTATAIRYGLNAAGASSLSDDQLRKFITLRQAKGATIAAKPKVKPKKIVPKNLFAPVKPKPVRKFTPPSPLGAITHTKGTPVASQGPVTQAVEARRPEAVRQQSQQRQETIRRQQLLRQNGFPVVVDGIWGPRSQAAWVKYKRHVPLPGRAVTKTAHPNQALPFSNISAETKRQQQQFQAQKEKEQRQAERAQADPGQAAHLADVKIARQQAALIAKAKVLREHPRVAAKWSLKQLTAVLTDKKTGFDLATSKAAASAIQYHLQARGYPVKVTGKPDQQTFTVLKTAFREEDLRAQAKRLTAIHDQVYAPLGLKAGDRPKGFPTGTVPTPRELDLILQKGGPKANQIMRYLNRHVVTSHDAWDAARWRQLEFIAEKRNPRFEAKNLKHPSHADILTALAAPFDYVGAKGRASLPEKDQKLAQFKGKTVWDSQLHAILTSDNPAEMKRKLVAYDAVNEQKFKRMQAEQAAHKSFWGKAFDDLLEPGKWTFTAGTVATSRLIQEGARLTGQDNGERDVSWEDAQIMLGYAKPGDFPGYDDLARKASGWLTVPGSLIIDPLNFVAPFKAASTLARFGRGASSLGRYTVEGEGLGKSLVYTKGTWSKAELARKIPGAVTVADSKSGQAAISYGKKLVEDKEKALAVVRGRVAQVARHGFDPVSAAAKKAVKVSKKPKNLADVKDGKVAVRSWIEDPSNPEFHGLIDELKKSKASIYLDAGRSTLSNVGASTLANWAEKVRVLAAHQLATDEALRMVDDLGFEQVKKEADDAFTAYRRGTGTLADAQAAGRKRAQVGEQITNAYVDAVDNAGTYISGGALKEDGHQLGKSILNRTLQKMDAIEDTILPTIQDILESHADEAFAAAKTAKAALPAGHVAEDVTHPLWDENGLWVSRNGEEADALRARSRAAFDPANLADVPNPAHGVAHTGGEMAEAIQFEVRRGLPRIYNFAHREKIRLGGEFKFDAEAAALKLEKEIRHSWEQRPDGHWYDTRPTTKVNKLYARNFKSVADSFNTDLAKYISGNTLDLPGLERIAAYGPTGVVDGFDDAANAMLWQLGSRFKKLPGFENVLGDATTRVRHVPGPPPGYLSGAKAKGDWYKAEFARLSEFSSAVSSYRVQLVKAADDVLPGELSKDLLFMRALAVHQAKWAKATYLSLNGFLRAWKFATLPLRPGWVVRNTVDNFAKAMVRSVRDPRFLLLGAQRPGSAIRTVFDLGVSPLRGAIRLLDGLFNTHALDEFDKMLEIFWNYPADILTKFFDLAALPAPPQSVLDSTRFSRQLDDWRAGNRAAVNVSLNDYANAELKPPLRLQKAEDKRAYERMIKFGDPTAAQRLAYKMRKTPETLWDLMGNKPENYFKRVIYRSELKKELRRLDAEGVTGVEAQMQAHEKAWDVVTETLFDYGTVSVVEDNLRVFMPFIQFWRKNTWFWMQTGVSKPWLPLSVLKLDEQRRMAHDDLPDWMKRYFHTDEIVDAAGVIPGLDTLVQMILPNNQMTDPTSFLSFAPLHRVFRDLVYGENQFLPPEDRAHGIAAKIIGPIVQAMDEWGLGLNPIVRKPMEVTGLIDSRDWQAVFPQTSLAEAFTLKFWGKDAMFKVAQWERVFTLGDDVHADKIAANFDFYVNREMAHQIIKGEPADRAKAEATVKATIWTQQLWGYFGGTYWRRATPEDIYIAKLQDDLRKGQIDFDHLPDKTKQILAVWSHTTGGAEAFDRYLASQELIKAFYKEPDADARAEMLTAHPALSEYVQVKSKPKGIGKNWIRNAQRYTETSRYFEAVKWADAIGATSEERQIAYDMFVTPDLKAFWDSNDTPKQIQDKMVKGEIYREMKGLQDAYFKIPETDFEARDGFLNEHPELTRYWQRHNDPADNYEAIMGGVKSDLRNLYFETVNTKGFAAAAPILKQFPFMFEGTKSEKKIKDGEWIVGYGKKGWDDARRTAWKGVQSYAHWFFNSYVKKVGFDAAFAWAEKQAATDPNAKAFLDYIHRYGKHHGSGGHLKPGWTPERLHAWSNIADFATNFFDVRMKQMGSDKAWDWLHSSNDPRAKALISYLAAYGKHSGGKLKPGWTPARLHAWSNVADFATNFFDVRMKHMGSDAAWDWLHASNDPKAKALISYLARYGKHDGKKLKPGWTPARVEAWSNVADFAKEFFEHTMKTMGSDKAWDWLHASDDPKAKALIAYLGKYGDHDGKKLKPGWTPARVEAWSHVADFAKNFFDVRMKTMGSDKAWDWLHASSDPKAKALIAYLGKYGDHDPKKLKPGWTPARQAAWGNVADFATNFFDVRMKNMGADKAWDWLHASNDPKAKALISYLAKYGDHQGKKLKPGWTPARVEAWSHVADFAKEFFDVRMKSMGEDKAWDWLHNSTDPQAKALLAYLHKYPSKASTKLKPGWTPARQQAWANVADFAKNFFDVRMKTMGEDKAWAWLRSSSDPKAKALVAYMHKYPSKDSTPKPGWTPERTQAWSEVADFAKQFFDVRMKQMGQQKAFDWLHDQAATNPQAQALLDYFAKYPGKKDPSKPHPSDNWSPERKAHWATVAHFARWFYDFYLPKVGEDKAWSWLRDQQGATAKQFMSYVDKYSTKEGKGKFSAERRNAYLGVKDFMGWFFDTYLPKVGEKRAYEWLRNSNDPQAQAAVAYLQKYGKHSQKSIDYKKAQHWLTLYHDLPEDQRQAWLDAGSEGAKIVRWYFDKYASSFDLTQHGKDYAAIQPDLKSYFAMPKEQRTAWLDAGSPEATRVLAYFKKYGKAHQYEREFKQLVAAYPALADGTPEQARRIQFWTQYFALTPDERPAFVHKHAEEYGVFIYGDLSETQRNDDEAEYDRRAVGLGISSRASDFLYVRPLLAYYETLGTDNKQLFLKANPELQDYFDKYSTYSPTGDTKLDLVVEHYFLLPQNSLLRSQMLKDHPELQDYFDAKASPAVAAMRNVLEQYFSIKNPSARKDFLLKHPEIRDYFDQRKAEKASEAAQLGAFEQADPRLKPYFKDNQDMRRSADMMARKLHHAAISSLEDATAELQLRRERQSAA